MGKTFLKIKNKQNPFLTINNSLTASKFLHIEFFKCKRNLDDFPPSISNIPKGKENSNTFKYQVMPTTGSFNNKYQSMRFIGHSSSICIYQWSGGWDLWFNIVSISLSVYSHQQRRTHTEKEFSYTWSRIQERLWVYVMCFITVETLKKQLVYHVAIFWVICQIDSVAFENL